MIVKRRGEFDEYYALGPFGLFVAKRVRWASDAPTVTIDSVTQNADGTVTVTYSESYTNDPASRHYTLRGGDEVTVTDESEFVIPANEFIEGDNALVLTVVDSEGLEGSDSETIAYTAADTGEDDIQDGTVDQPPTDFDDPNNEAVIETAPGGGKRIKVPKAQDGHVFYPLNAPQLDNVEFRMEFETNGNEGWQWGIGVRYASASGGTLYLLRTSDTALQLAKVVNGTYTEIGTFALSYTADTRYYIQLYADETAIKGMAWKKSEAMPGAWQIEVTNSDVTGNGLLTGYAHKAGNKYIYSYAWRDLDEVVDLPDTVSPVAAVLGTVTAGDGTLTIEQDTPASDNIGVTSGLIEWSDDAFATVTGSRAATSGELTGDDIELTGLTNATEYSVRMTVEDAAGNEAVSNVVTGTPGAVVVPTLRGYAGSTNGSINTNVASANKPTGTVEGDSIYAFLFTDIPGSITITPPTGFDLIESVTQSGGWCKLHVYRKVATGSEPSSYTWNFGSSMLTNLHLVSIIDADASTAYDVKASSDAGSGTSYAAPTVTPTAETYLLLFYGARASFSAGDRWTADAATAELGETRAGSNVGSMVAGKTVAAGATGTFTATTASESTALRIMYSLAVLPA